MTTRKLAFVALAVIGATSAALPPGATLVPGGFEPGRQPDGNTVVFDVPDGLVVFDTGRHPEHSRKILDLAAARKEPIVAIVNSHWHLDHVSGNPRLRAAFPHLKVYASDAIDGAMHGFLADSKKQAMAFVSQDEVPAAIKAEVLADVATIDSGKAVYPDIVIAKAGVRDFGGRKLQVGLEHAATRGDVWLYDPKGRFLASGDLVTLPVPFLDTACAPSWSAALARMDQIRFDSLVPGHGLPMDHAAFHSYRVAFDAFVACAATDKPAKDCADGWILDAGALLPEAERSRSGGMLEYYVGVLRDPDKRRLACD